MCSANADVRLGPISDVVLPKYQAASRFVEEARREEAIRSGERMAPLSPSLLIARQASELLARVRRSVLDLLHDLIQIPARRVLKGRKLFVGLELLEPQQLADG
jgi:hypothetical protein